MYYSKKPSIFCLQVFKMIHSFKIFWLVLNRNLKLYTNQYDVGHPVDLNNSVVLWYTGFWVNQEKSVNDEFAKSAEKMMCWILILRKFIRTYQYLLYIYELRAIFYNINLRSTSLALKIIKSDVKLICKLFYI